MATEARFVTLLGATGVVRKDTYNGREHLVVPVIALVEGVIHPVNAPAPELVRAECFTPSVAEWEGKPLMAGHPMRGREPLAVGDNPDLLRESFGLTRNPRVDSKRLCMEAWLDPSRMTEGHSAKILDAVTSEPPKPVEVSVGVWTPLKNIAGVWTNGKRYAGEWQPFKPDHLALFADGRKGACSTEMGCGLPRVAMRVAEDGQSVELEDVAQKGRIERLLDRLSVAQVGKLIDAVFFRSAMPRGWGDDEVKQELREALEVVEPIARTGGEIIRVKNDAVIYCLYPPANYYDSPMGPTAKMTYWQRSYTFDTATQKFTVAPERTQVEPTTHYEPYRASAVQELPESLEPTLNAACACGNHAAAAAGENIMDRSARIAALVANPHSPVKSLKMLEAASDEELAQLETSAGALKAAAEATAPVPATTSAAAAPVPAAATAAPPASTPAPTAAATVETEDEVLARFPGIKAAVESHRAAQTAQQTALVTTIRAAGQAFTEDELRAMSIEQLTKLATFAKVDVPKIDYSGRGVPRSAAAAADSLASYAPPDPYADPKAAVN